MVVMATRLPQRARNPSADVVDIGSRCVGPLVYSYLVLVEMAMSWGVA